MHYLLRTLYLAVSCMGTGVGVGGGGKKGSKQHRCSWVQRWMVRAMIPSGVAGNLSNSKTAEKTHSLTDLMKTIISGCFHDTANLVVITDRDTWKMKDLNIYSTFLSLLNKVVFKLSGTTHLHLCTALYHAHRKMFVIHQSIKSWACKTASCLKTTMIKFDTHTWLAL